MRWERRDYDFLLLPATNNLQLEYAKYFTRLTRANSLSYCLRTYVGTESGNWIRKERLFLGFRAAQEWRNNVKEKKGFTAKLTSNNLFISWDFLLQTASSFSSPHVGGRNALLNKFSLPRFFWLCCASFVRFLRWSFRSLKIKLEALKWSTGRGALHYARPIKCWWNVNPKELWI